MATIYGRLVLNFSTENITGVIFHGTFSSKLWADQSTSTWLILSAQLQQVGPASNDAIQYQGLG